MRQSERQSDKAAFRRAFLLLALGTTILATGIVGAGTGAAFAQEAPPSGGGAPGGGMGGGTSLPEAVQEDTETLLGGIDSLPQSTFDANLQATIDTYNAASEARIELAIADAEHGSSPITTILGTTINDLLDASETFSSAVSSASSLTSSDASYAKSYFGETNAYGLAYGSDSSTGNPRPFVVSDEIEARASASGSSYPSGHSTSGYTYSLLYAITFPEAYQALLYRGAEYAESRVVLGVHYALDTIAARIVAMKDIVSLLANDPDYLDAVDETDFASEFSTGMTELRDSIETETGTTVAALLASELSSDYTADADQEARYTYLLTYGLTNGESTDDPAVVPENAELLIATRFPYLDNAQLRDVLATTELSSGVALDDGTGWARLNLYAAANGYGAFDSDVTVDMDASEGGYSASDTWSNDIGGIGGLTKLGTGALALTGDNSFSGGLDIEEGTLVVDSASAGTGAIVDNAVLLLNQEEDGTLSNTLSGTGDLLKYGSATLRYTGDGSAFTGATLVAEGRLAVDGDLSKSDVGVGEGAELGGTGTVGSLYALEGGTVAPGNSIGTLTVAGDLVLNEGSVLEVETDAEGNSDLLAVAGGAAIDGAEVVVDAEAGDYDWKTDYTILTAADGIDGVFDGVSTNFAFLEGSLGYSATAVTLTLTRNDLSFASAATTDNRKAVASAVEALGEENAVYDTVMTASAAEVDAAFEDLSGDFYPGLDTVFLSQALDFGTAIRRHDAERASGGAAKRGAWASAFGRHADFDGKEDVASVGSDLYGLAFGFDALSDDGWTLGLSGTASSGTADGATGETADIDNYGIGLLASKQFGPTELRLGGSFSFADVSTTRHVTANALSQRLKADYNARTGSVFAEIGREIRVSGGVLTPFMGLTYAHLATDSFSETGGSMALSAPRAADGVGFSEMGLRLRRDVAFRGAPLGLTVAASWSHGFDVDPEERAMAISGSGFTVAGQPLAQDALNLDFGMVREIAPNATLSAAYSGHFGEGVSASEVKLKASWRF